MLPSIHTSLLRTADVSRQVAGMAMWDATTIASPASYFYGYWFSHWRA
ncbi:hypothetical protein [Pseudomonas sp. SLFW]|nr:hypothetical protein [Pseudomonas sp. SLFW]NBB09580.1 hypothetical protein [Pseudomonas sp. SLFW]